MLAGLSSVILIACELLSPTAYIFRIGPLSLLPSSTTNAKRVPSGDTFSAVIFVGRAKSTKRVCCEPSASIEYIRYPPSRFDEKMIRPVRGVKAGVREAPSAVSVEGKCFGSGTIVAAIFVGDG